MKFVAMTLLLIAGQAAGLRRKQKGTTSLHDLPEVAYIQGYMAAQKEDQLSSGELDNKLGYLYCDDFKEQHPQYSITCGKIVDKKKSNFQRVDYLSQGVSETKCVEVCDSDDSCIGFQYSRNSIYLHGACELFKEGEGDTCLDTSGWGLPLVLHYAFMKQGRVTSC